MWMWMWMRFESVHACAVNPLLHLCHDYHYHYHYYLYASHHINLLRPVEATRFVWPIHLPPPQIFSPMIVIVTVILWVVVLVLVLDPIVSLDPKQNSRIMHTTKTYDTYTLSLRVS